MAFAYQPLNDDEIRLVRIEPANSGADRDDVTLVCSIENVQLSTRGYHMPKERIRGDNYKWPEACSSSRYDTSANFKDGIVPDLLKDIPSTTDSPETLHDAYEDDDHFSWRYSWGDFVALSYVWNSTGPPRSILLNGVPFLVKSNLYDARVKQPALIRI